MLQITKKYPLIVSFAMIIAVVTAYHFWFSNEGNTVRVEHVSSTPSAHVLYSKTGEDTYAPLDFTEVARKVVDAVVHIRSTGTVDMTNQRTPQVPDAFRDFFRDFFDEMPGERNLQPQPRVGQGSGVIISTDGYIVTNNHVIANADDVEVTLSDNQNYDARIIGTDPTTDLALIKIDAEDLPNIPFVDSDDVEVGEWVLAVGNPFNLTSTITAGIVSAKARNINILREQFAVESFIQTDAVINPGNSGGALVNLEGGLVGINTAIASPTGVYSGYGFAVPANIVQKIVEDLIEYGVVQRGVLGVMIRTVDGDLAREEDLGTTRGAYVDSLMDGSAAEAAGIRPGDVIIEVEGQEIDNSPMLQESIARRRPGDVVEVVVMRNGDRKTFDVTLKSRDDAPIAVAREYRDILNTLGVELEPIDKKTAQSLDIEGGLQVKNLYAGKLRQSTQMRKGFIITKVDGKRVSSVDDFVRILESRRGGVMLEGMYPDDKEIHYYAFGM